jgi:hypothetical protein
MLDIQSQPTCNNVSGEPFPLSEYVLLQNCYFVMAFGRRKRRRKGEGDNSEAGMQQRAPISVARGEVLAK